MGIHKTQGQQCSPRHCPCPQLVHGNAPSSAPSTPTQRRRAFCPQLAVVMLTPGKRAAPGASDPTPDPSLEPEGQSGLAPPHPVGVPVLLVFMSVVSHRRTHTGWETQKLEVRGSSYGPGVGGQAQGPLTAPSSRKSRGRGWLTTTCPAAPPTHSFRLNLPVCGQGHARA